MNKNPDLYDVILDWVEENYEDNLMDTDMLIDTGMSVSELEDMGLYKSAGKLHDFLGLD
ncbi:MAG: hypothetical protein ACOC2W_03175 [bacterium]